LVDLALQCDAECVEALLLKAQFEQLRNQPFQVLHLNDVDMDVDVGASVV